MGSVVQRPWGAPGEWLGRMGAVIQEICHAGGAPEGGQRSLQFSSAPLTRSSVARPAAPAVGVPHPASSSTRGANRGDLKESKGPRLLTRRSRRVPRDSEKSASWGRRRADSTGGSRGSGTDDVRTGRSRPAPVSSLAPQNPRPK